MIMHLSMPQQDPAENIGRTSPLHSTEKHDSTL